MDPSTKQKHEKKAKSNKPSTRERVAAKEAEVDRLVVKAKQRITDCLSLACPRGHAWQSLLNTDALARVFSGSMSSSPFTVECPQCVRDCSIFCGWCLQQCTPTEPGCFNPACFGVAKQPDEKSVTERQSADAGGSGEAPQEKHEEHPEDQEENAGQQHADERGGPEETPNVIECLEVQEGSHQIGAPKPCIEAWLLHLVSSVTGKVKRALYEENPYIAQLACEELMPALAGVPMDLLSLHEDALLCGGEADSWEMFREEEALASAALPDTYATFQVVLDTLDDTVPSVYSRPASGYPPCAHQQQLQPSDDINGAPSVAISDDQMQQLQPDNVNGTPSRVTSNGHSSADTDCYVSWAQDDEVPYSPPDDVGYTGDSREVDSRILSLLQLSSPVAAAESSVYHVEAPGLGLPVFPHFAQG